MASLLPMETTKFDLRRERFSTTLPRERFSPTTQTGHQDFSEAAVKEYRAFASFAAMKLPFVFSHTRPGPEVRLVSADVRIRLDLDVWRRHPDVSDARRTSRSSSGASNDSGIS